MRRLVVANWKANGSLAFVESYFSSFPNGLRADVEVVVLPPFPYLQLVGQKIKDCGNKNVFFGAQTFHKEGFGAFTGCVTVEMLNDLHCSHVVIGHSEDRKIRNLSTADLRDLVLICGRKGINPIFCIGEENPDVKEAVLIQELTDVLSGIDPSSLKGIVVAYEPVWAIGSGLVPPSEKVLGIVSSLTTCLRGLNIFDARVVYGGSVTEENINLFASVSGLHGVMLGGASLLPNKVLSIAERL